MRKARSPAANYAIYLLLRLAVCLVQALPPSAARGLADALAWLAYRVDRRHRLVALENIARAFPEQASAEARARTVAAVYRHFCGLAVEIALLPRKLHANNWRRQVRLRGGRGFVGRLLSGRPLLIVTGHFGNWELAGYALALLGFPAHAVARPLDNPYLDAFLRRFRERTGQRVLSKKGDFDRMRQILADGGVLATLADQDAGPRGLFVDYFGRPASTHKAIALLALEHKVPIVVAGTPRTARPAGHEIVLEDEVLPEEFEGRPDAVREITQRFTTGLERLVRRAPEQYFWLHRRWKHGPPRGRRRAA